MKIVKASQLITLYKRNEEKAAIGFTQFKL